MSVQQSEYRNLRTLAAAILLRAMLDASGRFANNNAMTKEEIETNITSARKWLLERDGQCDTLATCLGCETFFDDKANVIRRVDKLAKSSFVLKQRQLLTIFKDV